MLKFNKSYFAALKEKKLLNILQIL